MTAIEVTEGRNSAVMVLTLRRECVVLVSIEITIAYLPQALAFLSRLVVSEWTKPDA